MTGGKDFSTHNKGKRLNLSGFVVWGSSPGKISLLGVRGWYRESRRLLDRKHFCLSYTCHFVVFRTHSLYSVEEELQHGWWVICQHRFVD